MSTFEKDLIASMKEALAMAQGEEIGHHHHFPNPKDVRKKAGLTQEHMAALLGVSTSGYRKWEQGKRAIPGPALNLLKLMEKHPKLVVETLAA